MTHSKYPSLPRRQQAGVLCWFSCGAASACVAKLASQEFGSDLELVYCDTMATEHPDNERFLQDVERWVGLPVKRLHSLRYQDVDDCFEQRKILSTKFGAPCTVEMKKRVRFEYQHAGDLHLFGMTADEGQRAKRFAANNPTSWDGHATAKEQECPGMAATAGSRWSRMSYDYKYVVEAPDGCQFEYAFQDAAEKLAKDVTRLLEACQ